MSPQDEKKDCGKSPSLPKFSKGKQPKSHKMENNMDKRRSSSLKKSRKNRRSSSKHRMHRSGSNSRKNNGIGGHHHRGHSHSVKKSPGKEPGLFADQKAIDRMKEKEPKHQPADESPTMLIAPPDYKVLNQACNYCHH